MSRWDVTYEVGGTVEAADGSSYRPVFIGGFFDSRRVLGAIVDGCEDRGDGFDLWIRRLDTGVAGTYWRRPVGVGERIERVRTGRFEEVA